MVILLAGKTINAENLPMEMTTEQKVSSNPFTLPDGGVVLEQLEAQLIHQALEKSQGNQSKAARFLGLTRSALLYRLNKYSN